VPGGGIHSGGDLQRHRRYALVLELGVLAWARWGEQAEGCDEGQDLLRCRDRVQAVVAAYEAGLVEPGRTR
jgi:hypothetical protein